MNYLMFAENVIEITDNEIITKMVFSAREEMFRRSLIQARVVPNFAILEAVFQTLGKIIKHRNDHGRYLIAAIKKIAFSRSLLSEEEILITGSCLNYNKIGYNFNFNIEVICRTKRETILTAGSVMMIAEKKVIN